jgi:CheY-like chemotaxis protein
VQDARQTRAPQQKLLIVDDEPAIRTLMSEVLIEIGFFVRSVEDGFSALVGIRNEIPDILLSDLYMPGISGFELLSVVHRRFPSIRVIAMSGAFSGDEVPSGVAAYAFYQKGCGVRSLLRIIGGLAQMKQLPANQQPGAAPLWIQRNGNDAAGEPYVSITCPDCLRTFQQTVGGSLSPMREAHCAHCGNTVTTQSSSRPTGRLDGRLKDVIPRQSRSASPSCIAENKKAIPYAQHR